MDWKKITDIEFINCPGVQVTPSGVRFPVAQEKLELLKPGAEIKIEYEDLPDQFYTVVSVVFSKTGNLSLTLELAKKEAVSTLSIGDGGNPEKFTKIGGVLDLRYEESDSRQETEEGRREASGRPEGSGL